MFNLVSPLPPYALRAELFALGIVPANVLLGSAHFVPERVSLPVPQHLHGENLQELPSGDPRRAKSRPEALIPTTRCRHVRLLRVVSLLVRCHSGDFSHVLPLKDSLQPGGTVIARRPVHGVIRPPPIPAAVRHRESPRRLPGALALTALDQTAAPRSARGATIA